MHDGFLEGVQQTAQTDSFKPVHQPAALVNTVDPDLYCIAWLHFDTKAWIQL